MTSRGSQPTHQIMPSQPRSALSTAHGGYAVIAIGSDGDSAISGGSSSTTSDPFHLSTGASALSGSSSNRSGFHYLMQLQLAS